MYGNMVLYVSKRHSHVITIFLLQGFSGSRCVTMKTTDGKCTLYQDPSSVANIIEVRSSDCCSNGCCSNGCCVLW